MLLVAVQCLNQPIVSVCIEFLLVSRKCKIARGKHSKRRNSSPRASACCCAITIGEKGGGGGGGGTKRRTKRTKRRTRECAFGQGDPDGLQQAPRRCRQLQLHLLRRKEGTGWPIRMVKTSRSLSSKSNSSGRWWAATVATCTAQERWWNIPNLNPTGG